MKIAVFGGTGRTGIHVVEKALAQGHEVTVLARTPQKMTISDQNLTVVPGDVEDKAAVAQTIAGSEGVISSLAPNLKGMQNILRAMEDAPVQRLVVTSGAGVHRPGDDPPLSSKIISWLIKTFSRQVYEDSKAIADALPASDTDWTLIRAPRLVDKPATGSLYIGPLNKNMKTTLGREDFADFLLAALTDERWIGQDPVVSDK